MTVLVTGATGFVGAFLAARLLERTERDLIALVRAPDARTAQARLDAALRPLLGAGGWDPARARALPADLTRPNLGMAARDRATTRERVSAVVHAAADVGFDRPLAAARAVNVDGTRRVLAFARELPGLERVVHVSTAYVAGTHVGRFDEWQLDTGQGFRNSYERSKHEAERLVRATAADLPLAVVRPSIVVGDSETGWTSAFNVLYGPLRALAGGLADRVPAEPDALVDVVPVDHVAAVAQAALDPATGPGPFHAVAADRAVTVRGLAELAAVHLDRPMPALVPPAAFADGGAGVGALRAYFPYFAVRTSFGDARTRRLGLRAPALPEYFGRIVDFAREAGWGRRPAARVRSASLGRSSARRVAAGDAARARS